MKEQGGFQVYEYPDIYAKSNILIGAKYKSTLLENKLMAISLSRVQYDEKSNVLFADIKAAELRKMLHANAGSFYTQLDNTANRMTGKSIGISNPETQEFDYIAVITRAKYKDGHLIIQFHSALKDYLYNIRNNFTKLQLSIMLSFKNVYSFRLYELLKSKAYFPKGAEKDEKVFYMNFSLAELKLELGIVNAELDAVRQVLHSKKNPDFNKAVEKSPEKMFDVWSEFRRSVLEPAIKEINENTDIRVEYTTKRGGLGAKIYAIDFKVEVLDLQNGKEEKKAVTLTASQKEDFLDEVIDLIDERIKIKEARSIAEEAEYDLEKIRTAYEVAKKTSNVENLVGFMIKAIRENYKITPVDNSKQKVVNSFNQYKQNEYDMEKLEEILLGSTQMTMEDIIQ